MNTPAAAGVATLAAVDRRLAVLAAAALAAACGSGDGEPGGAPASTPAVALAPSQQSSATVAPPEAPPLCDPAAVVTGLGEPSDDADVVVTFHNTSPVTCEVNLGEPWAREHEIEPDVWLAPGATAELWAVCAAPAGTAPPATAWTIEVNGSPREFAVPCAPEPVAFF